jgi:hexosaminidase
MKRHPLGRLFAISALVATSIVVVGGASPAAAAEPAPQVVPALQSWTGGTGRVTLNRTGRIVIPTGSPAGLQRIATQLAGEAAELTPLRMTVLTGSPAAGDIQLRLDAAATYGSVSAALKPEAYRMIVGSGRVELVGAGEKGLYYATRTLLQTLLQSTDRISAPLGTAVDFPDYAVRGFMLDVGRRYFTPQFLNSYIRWMGWLKLNTFQLHLNDNEIQAPNGDWSQAQSAFRLRSTNPAFAGLAATDGSYSRADWDGFETTALAHGVTILPEIDAPAHSRAFIKFRPSLGLNGGNSDNLDLSKPESTEFMKSVYNEFVPWFRGSAVHVGLDEYPREYVADYQRYHNAISAHVRGLGKTVNVWGSYQVMSGGTAGYDKNVTVNLWNNGWFPPTQAVNDGYRVINMTDSQLYVVPFANYYQGQGLDGQSIFVNWSPHIFGGDQNLTPQHPNLLGAMSAVWNDLVRATYTEADVHRLVERAFNSLAQKMWSQGDAGTDYAAFMGRVIAVGQGPGTSYLADTLAPTANDIARGKTATASSSETAGLGPANAVDGIVGTRWASQYTNDQWLRVDLGSAQAFNRVRLVWEAAYARDYDIEISSDGTAWTSVAQRRGVTAAATATIDVGSRNARYVRMRGITRGTEFGYSLFSFEVLAGGGPGPITGLGGKCLDILGANSANGSPAVIWTCGGGVNQRFTRAANDALQVMGKCLDVNGGSTADGAKVQIWDCNGGGGQRWVPQTNGTLLNPQSGKCLDVTGNNPADGTLVTIWTCGTGANQRWTLP